jgi:hypothetical protein
MRAQPVALALLLFAASSAPAAPNADMQKLDFLVGEWVHEEVHQGDPSGVGVKGAARSKNAWIHGGHHLYHLYKSKRPEGELEGRALLDWDAESNRYRLHWFDSRGQTVRLVGTFDPDGVLVFRTEPPSAAYQVKVKRLDGGKILFSAPQLESLAQQAASAPPPRPTSTAGPGGSPVATPTGAPAAPPSGDSKEGKD